MVFCVTLLCVLFLQATTTNSTTYNPLTHWGGIFLIGAIGAFGLFIWLTSPGGTLTPYGKRPCGESDEDVVYHSRLESEPSPNPVLRRQRIEIGIARVEPDLDAHRNDEACIELGEFGVLMSRDERDE